MSRLEYERRVKKELYHKRKDAGVCVTCGKAPATEESGKCKPCMEAFRVYCADRRNYLRDHKRCLNCSRKLQQDYYFMTCEECRKKDRARRARLRDANH